MFGLTRLFYFCVFVSVTLFCGITNYTRAKHEGQRIARDELNWRGPPPLKPIFDFGESNASIFPPSAEISLTDDNSTSFPARPAAFGPPIAKLGFSGQLWVGGGSFSGNFLNQEDAEGELGCSDAPGWDDALPKATLGKDGPSVESGASATNGHLDLPVNDDAPAEDDGTDDHLLLLHRRARFQAPGNPVATLRQHADIQSIQEAAEITGKIVLLSRGGCGFLDKVKWAQRRGAIGLIVGDNRKGGPLIQMYARGDVSNVTIPSIFTSWTTAHLLSSLMQPNHFRARTSSKLALDAQQLYAQHNSRPPVFPPPIGPIRPTLVGASDGKVAGANAAAIQSGQSPLDDASSRPPSSGRLDWVLVDDFNDEKDRLPKTSLETASAANQSNDKGTHTSKDDFQIGVQDWRDPDLVGRQGDHDAAKKPTQSGLPAKDSNGPKGGIVTPGSGEYGHSSQAAEASAANTATAVSILHRIFGDSDRDNGLGTPPEAESLGHSTRPTVTAQHSAVPTQPAHYGDTSPPEHDGLWVTITPTGNINPFFDTVLVLVVSPLITLSAVYALLMIRGNLYRRRWRAPKSVIERLPVRTYFSAPSTPSTPTPTTPLLLGSSGARNRTRTPPDSNVPRMLPEPGHGYPGRSSTFVGRQKECVVCLEEYIDGQTLVMRLPCGHEFHPNCITPWLTTRRRTCPICKGDVVRSLARGPLSYPHYEPYRDVDSDYEDDILDTNTAAHSNFLIPPSRGRAQWERQDGWLAFFPVASPPPMPRRDSD